MKFLLVSFCLIFHFSLSNAQIPPDSIQAFQNTDSLVKINLGDSVLIAKTADLKFLYESHRKVHEIALLEKERLFKIKLRLVLIISLVLVLIAVGLAFRFNHQKSKGYKLHNGYQEELLSAEQEMLLMNLKKSLFNEQNLKEELLNRKLIEKQLREELSLKNQSLATYSLANIRKNNFLEELKKELKNIKKLDKYQAQKAISHLISTIHSYTEQEEHWTDFQRIFEEVHIDFFKNLKSEFPELSPAELRLSALLKLNLNSSDIATILGISQDSLRVARYRLRKKLNLSKGSNLISYLMVQ